jgi:hypothetical protein
MDDLDNLDDVVLFELPSGEDADAFAEHFRGQWSSWSHPDGTLWLFAVEFGTSRDIVPLLREAQELLAELGLTTARYCLDGRVYDLHVRPDRLTVPRAA